MSPAGLFAFTMINGLEGIYMLMELTDGSFVSHSYMYLYGPYAFFVGGLLQLLVAMWEVTRVRLNCVRKCCVFVFVFEIGRAHV